MSTRLDEILDKFFILRAASASDDLDEVKLRNEIGSAEEELGAEIKSLMLDLLLEDTNARRIHQYQSELRERIKVL